MLNSWLVLRMRPPIAALATEGGGNKYHRKLQVLGLQNLAYCIKSNQHDVTTNQILV